MMPALKHIYKVVGLVRETSCVSLWRKIRFRNDKYRSR